MTRRNGYNPVRLIHCPCCWGWRAYIRRVVGEWEVLTCKTCGHPQYYKLPQAQKEVQP